MEKCGLRFISTEAIEAKLVPAIKRALTSVDARAGALLKNALEKETENARAASRSYGTTHTDSAACWALSKIIENNALAEAENSPACQDTGMAVFFVEIGRNAHIDGDIEKTLNDCVEKAYREGYFRQSVLDPLTRKNTGTNTPAVVYYSFADGESLKIDFLPKGAGSENMSALYMLTPSKGRQGIVGAVTDAVKKAGANPCPPLFLGVGIGGTADLAQVLAKRALLRIPGVPHADAETAGLEREILGAVNALGIGVQGFGGEHTALSVAVESFPTHIGMLPVAVNLQCHCLRHARVVV